MELNSLPFVDEYYGVWGMWEPKFNALVNHAQTLNIQVHLESIGGRREDIAARASTELNVTRDGIAVIELRGTMMKHASSFSANASTVAIRQQVRAAARDEAVAGIMMVVDSPGGTAAGTMDLAADIRKAAAAKPFYSFAEDLVASAAYWAVSPSSKIIMNSSGIAGSIGVFSVVHDLSKAADDAGIVVHVIRAGDFKGTATPGTPVTEDQIAEFQKLVDAIYGDFISDVATGRGLAKTVVQQLADGRVHRGQAAVELKLVDALGTFEDAMSELVAQTKTSQRSQRTMAEEKDTGVQADETPKAATIAELKESLPGASSDFILSQVESGATMEAALKAFVGEQAKANEQLAKEAEEAKKAVAENKVRGNQALKDGSTDNEGEGESFEAAFNARLASGMDRTKAMRETVRENPERHKAYLDEYSKGVKVA